MKVKVIKESSTRIIGDSVYLYITCPEWLNGKLISINNIYTVKVTYANLKNYELVTGEEIKENAYSTFKKLDLIDIRPGIVDGFYKYLNGLGENNFYPDN